MKSLAMAAAAVGVFASAAIGLAGSAVAAPAGPSSVDQTVDKLQADGFHVIVNKVGTAPLDQCVVSGLRPGQTFSRMDSGVPGAMDDIVTTVTSMTVYVDATC
ncbi:hypothetical protein [Mycobacterium sp. URHB0044]|jgi:hypothetical protein|uniref:hypothetical protein n=1 Tax=Mycobacterium sp. URHB0044 TaxID=1380386 RepID=UPI00048BD1E0|nr:hypothetical protein [Mycobacterium sp. URHB0044]